MPTLEVVYFLKQARSLHIIKMKYLVTFALLFLTMTSIAQGQTLKQDIDQLINLIPVQDVENIIIKYIENQDPQLIQFIQLLKQDTTKTLIDKVTKLEPVVTIMAYLKENNVYNGNLIEDLMNLIDSIDISKVKYIELEKYDMKALWKEIRGVLPEEKILQTFIELATQSADFSKLLHMLSSDEMASAVRDVQTWPETAAFDDELKNMGVDVEGLKNMIFDLIGWK